MKKTYRWAGLALVLVSSGMVTAFTASSAGAAQTCDGTGPGGTPSGQAASADLDGNGTDDDVYVYNDSGEDSVKVVVVLDNGYTTEWADGPASGPTVGLAKVIDIDKDGDDELIVNEGTDEDGATHHQLFAFTGCDLKRISSVSGTNPTATTFADEFGGFSLDCVAPSAAGRGVSTFAVEIDGATASFTRTEYLLVVNDAEGDFEWTETRDETIDGLALTDPRVVYANEGILHCVGPASCNGKVVTIAGTPIDDVVNGTRTRDVVSTGDGEDSITSKGGRDLVCAGDDADTLKLGKGRDRGYGEDGNDTINGGLGKDRADGGAGTDTCSAERKVACE